MSPHAPRDHGASPQRACGRVFKNFLCGTRSRRAVVAEKPHSFSSLYDAQMVNAYYHPMLNEIVFPAAILQVRAFILTFISHLVSCFRAVCRPVLSPACCSPLSRPEISLKLLAAVMCGGETNAAPSHVRKSY